MGADHVWRIAFAFLFLLQQWGIHVLDLWCWHHAILGWQIFGQSIAQYRRFWRFAIHHRNVAGTGAGDQWFGFFQQFAVRVFNLADEVWRDQITTVGKYRVTACHF